MSKKNNTEATVIVQKLKAKQGHIGVLTLNVEKTLNSLTLEMVNTLSTQLTNWAVDDEISLVVLIGSGDKAFCSGADIQALYQSAKHPVDGVCEQGEAFFLAEYQLNYQIHCYDKPLICIGNGYVMGGGLGLLAGASHRVVTESTRVAMPEITIGLYPDVGGTYFLSHIPYNLGFFFGLTGAHMNAKDAIFCKLADYILEWQRYPELLSNLETVAWDISDNRDDKNHHLVDDVLKDMAPDSSAQTSLLAPSNILSNLSVLETTCQKNSLSTIISGIQQFDEENHWLAKAKTNFNLGSPLSSVLIYEQLKRFKYADLQTVFYSELILSTNIIRYPEFAEGVRALLVDKDHSPTWQFSHFSHVPNSLIKHFFSPPWSQNPLEGLLK